VAIVQISRITNRKGLTENLPQLAGAEFGWCIDSRRLFIGNGTLQAGAPVIGNTEVLTEFSNILELQNSYTYKGEAGGYIVQTGSAAGSPVTQSLQARLDSFAVVTDFGAVGDGVTDNTDAINRALYQLNCRSNNTSVRRGLFFPAGVYLITESIIIPPYAYLYGDGPTASVIKLDVASDISTLNAYVARTGDSLQQTGAQIANNGATPPQEITIMNIGFSSLQITNLFLVDCAHDVLFYNCGFVGPITQAMIAGGSEEDIAGLTFNSTGSLISNNISCDQCVFTNLTYGIYANDITKGIDITNCHFDTLYEGAYLTSAGPGAPSGVRITNSYFDTIYKRAIVFDNVAKNVSGYNTFNDCGNRFTATPVDPIIYLNAAQNVSVYDMFDRSDSQVQSTKVPRIETLNAPVINIDNGSYLDLGNYQIGAAVVETLPDNQAYTTLFTTDASAGSPLSGQFKAFQMTYTFKRNTSYRTGVLTVTTNPGLIYSEDYNENASTGLTFIVGQVSDTVTVSYQTSSTGYSGELTYSLSHLA
jgi:hypothetical protein